MTQAQEFIGRIADVAKRFNDRMAALAAKMRKAYPDFDHLQMEEQRRRIEQERASIVADFSPEVVKLAVEVEEAAKGIPLAIGKVKYPNVTGGDRMLGETQSLNARLFLSTKPAAASLLNEIRSGLTLGRPDYASTLYDAARASIPTDTVPTEEQYRLKTGLDDIPLGDKKLAELEAERAAFPDVQRIVASLVEQVQRGNERLFLPDLMTDDEIEAAKGTGGYNLTEVVMAQRRKMAGVLKG